MIDVENLVKRYGSHTAVDHLSFHVEQGQIYGFLGPNGAGKSTTMNIMTGYLAASEGSVKINGYDVLKEPEKAKGCIGYLPEIPPVYTDMTVEEYLAFAAELKRIPRAKRKEAVAEVMEMTMITEVKSRLIRNLSKGYKQRVGLAQAVLGNPEVLILDEPTVGLDPKQIMEIRDLIKRLGEKHTVILSSHILSEVSAVCDHIMIIAKGKLVASDSPEGLQRLMNAQEQIELTLRGDRNAAETVLKEIPGVLSVQQQETEEEEGQSFMVAAGEREDVREAIFYACARARLPILAMSYKRKSLEEIFLELTEEEADHESNL